MLKVASACDYGFE